ncbi:hypothetical protein GALMADRAFT_209383 [Galerina marginata CBS 339.88]|uniref:MARVEL domain-containing protein n=1 Tax=Galerina marginata (strain CBS 339.88) TaxID=685588 RepID=A0A067T691_GALM3|nr:hypothetical protein GALMADRAFT_209383 [Galerina marginata CBS 339.88]
MAESAPLLEEHHGEFEAQTNVSSEKAPPPFYFKILTIITFLFSVVTLGLLIANHIIIRHAPFNGYTWATQDATKGLGKFVFVSVIFSVINLLVNFPILLNVIVDVVLASGIISWVFRLVDAFPNSWCRDPFPRPGIPYPEPDPKCQDWTLVVKILTGIAAGLGGILGLVYITLLVLRSVALIRSKFWKRPIALNFPTGKISLEISLKLLRQEGGSPGNAGGQSAEASEQFVGSAELPITQAGQ